LGINCGHLGFLADVQTRDVDSIMRQLIDGQYTIEQRSLLRVSCNKDNLIMAPFALNEVSILKQGFSSMISIEATVNGQLLHRYHADGLVIATPTGSTAYNLSIGGPLIVPQSKVMVLSPIATHSLTVRPLVIPEDWKIDLKVQGRYGNYMISVDGRSQILSDEVQLHIERAPYTVKLVQIGENSFLGSLRTKLNWGK
jgi:NAD+ kinase